ncbi:MAG: hypothetical protein AAGD32_03890 [Planctomycetota bacterium]
MLLQTNSYIVPKEKRSEHARLMRRFREVMERLGCTRFEVFEQTGPNWTRGDASGRFIQMIAFRSREHQREVQSAEQSDPAAQQLVQNFCELVNYEYQQQQGLFASGFYCSTLDGGLADAEPRNIGQADEPMSIDQIEASPDDDLADTH